MAEYRIAEHQEAGNVPCGEMHTRRYEARVYSHDRGDFPSVRNSNVLIYWPHGFGDWVHFGYVLPLFERSNRYWITRFGDDNVAVMEGNEFATPVYLGVNSAHCGDGEKFGNRHFGLRHEDVDGGPQELKLPVTLYEVCRQNNIEAVFDSWYPEVWGSAAFPFHTKARNLLRHVLPKETDRVFLDQPLKNSINFHVEPWVTSWVDSRLANWAGTLGRKLCVVGRNGYTAIGKNWGHRWREDMPPGQQHEGEECREFMRLMLRKDPRWFFLVVEDRLFENEHTVRSREWNCCSYAELFGTPDSSSVPFGIVMKAILNRADLCVGVPAGPLHLATAKRDLPTVGIWIEHLPSWYDEPKEAAIHVVSNNLRNIGAMERPGSFERRDSIEYRIQWADSRIISGEQVLNAVENLIY